MKKNENEKKRKIEKKYGIEAACKLMENFDEDGLLKHVNSEDDAIKIIKNA